MAKNMTINNSSGTSSDYFKTSWNVYRKVLEGNYMSHVEAYAVLGDVLRADTAGPFNFLDLACGDAYYSSRVLGGTQVSSYTGIDLSEAALEKAREELTRLSCPKELIIGDLSEFQNLISEPYQVIWLGLSLHHFETEEKGAVMKKAYETLNDDGIYLIYEPVFIDREDRAGYYVRIKSIIERAWTGLSAQETKVILEHVRETEHPETADTWITLGKDAGFSSVQNLYIDPSELYGLFRYKK